MQKYTDDNSVSVDADATSDQPLASEEPVPKKLKLFSFMSTSSQNTHSAGIALTLRQELIEYLCTSTVEYEHDPLEWWKSHAVEFSYSEREREFTFAKNFLRSKSVRLSVCPVGIQCRA